MGRPVTLDTPLRDPHLESVADLEHAPANHAEALLELLEVVEGLHRRGVLTVARGVLAAGDTLVENAVDALDSPQVTRGLRNLIALAKIAGAIDPEVVSSLARAVEEVTRESQPEEPPSTLSLLAQLRSSEVRRGLAFASRSMAILGRELRNSEQKRKAQAKASRPKAV